MKVDKVSQNRTLYIDDAVTVEFKSGSLLFIREGCLIKKIALNTSASLKLFGRISLVERLSRLEPRYLTKINDKEFVLSHNGKLTKIEPDTGRIETIFEYSEGTKNPLHFCKYRRNGEDEIVFGDYGGKDNDGNVGVFRVEFADGWKVKKIASISSEIIDHIHAVKYDQYRDCYWIFSGDSDKGAGIWQLGYFDSQPSLLVGGEQKFRACVASIKENSILYATDSPNSQNYIIELDIDSKNTKIIEKIDGSCIYGFSNDLGDFLATTVEPDSLLPKWRYIFSYKLGAGIKSWYSFLYMLSGDKKCDVIWKGKKDIYPMLLFQFGNIRFPDQHVNDRVYFCPQSLKKALGTYAVFRGEK